MNIRRWDPEALNPGSLKASKGSLKGRRLSSSIPLQNGQWKPKRLQQVEGLGVRVSGLSFRGEGLRLEVLGLKG